MVGERYSLICFLSDKTTVVYRLLWKIKQIEEWESAVKCIESIDDERDEEYSQAIKLRLLALQPAIEPL